ncbi:MAG: SUMF1/EgtB/PvdO family nonheme iron enzyme [Rubrivivax sp.]|nr:SUMF1/EgtB/PvdO family nonheme iron enzyme [Rubrivivax sp.]
MQAQGRRAPAAVEQLHGAVAVIRGGGLKQAAAGQPAMHVSRYEAQARCSRAGRRLPTEPEWELAACTAASRGFVWGDVLDWVAGSARARPGASWPIPPGTWDTLSAPPGTIDALPPRSGTLGNSSALGPSAATTGVLCGASFATRLRWHHLKARRFTASDSNRAFCGFRSCAL